MQEKPKALLISHNFPPTAGPESGLVKLNAEFLHRQGMQVRVLTTTQVHTTQGMDPSLLHGLSPEIIVDRVASPEAVLTERLPRAGRLTAVGAGSFILPEIYLPWMFPATKRGAQIIQDWQPDVLYSRATKHVSNVVGWRLKRATALPWIAHFSDPWISAGLPYRPLQHLIGRYYEKRILRDADKLVFVAPQAAQRVLSSYPQHWHKRIQIIPHGYEPLTPEIRQVRPAAQRGRPLRMIHAGAFYPSMRTPDTLIEALRRLQQRQTLTGRLEIHCVGVDTTCYQPQVEAAGVREVLRLRQSVPYDECQRLVAASDMTLIIDTPGFGGIFLPTKMIEAFAFDHPVLGLADKDSAVADVLLGAGLHWADLNDPDDIARSLTTLLAKWESGNWGLTPTQRQNMDRFQIDRINQPLLEIFEELAGRGRSS
jgi:hypothetical protein